MELNKNILIIAFVFLFFDGKSGNLNIESNLITTKTENVQLDLKIYNPIVQHKVIAPPEGLYRHVPSIALSFDNELMGAYLRNQVSNAESVRGQTAVFIRSNDHGNSWSEPIDELNSGNFTENPLDPISDNMLQGEIHVAFIQNKEYACIVHRGGPRGGNGTYLAVREKEGKWKIKRFLFSNNNAIQLSSNVIGKTPPSGLKATYTIEGEEYDIVLFKPIEDNQKRILIPAVFLTSYGDKHRIGVFIINGTEITLAGIIPLGNAQDASAWEPTLWQARNETYYIQCRNNVSVGEPSFDNHLISSSANLSEWSPMEFLAEDIHVNRQMRMKVRSDLWMGVGASHRSLRRSLVAYHSVDGVEWVHGARIGVEDKSNDWTHYSDIACDETNAYVLYSETVDKAQYGNHVNCIKFAKFPLPLSASLLVSGSPKAYYESVGVIDLPIVDETHLTLVPGSSGSLTTPKTSWALNLVLKVSSIPTSNAPYTIVSVGDEESGYFSVEYKRNGSIVQLWVNGSCVEDISNYNVEKEVSISYDYSKNEITGYGKTKVLNKNARVYLGNYKSTLPTPSGSIIYNIGASSFLLGSYTVAFQSNSSAGPPSPITVTFGSTITKPTDPVVADSTFRGWFKDAALTQAFNFDQPVNDNITLYAKWLQNKFDFRVEGTNTFGFIWGLKPEFANETDLYIPYNIGGKRVARIEVGAFKRNVNITSVEIEDNPKMEGTAALNDSAFAFCTNLETFVFPNNLGKIGIGCFQGCTSLGPVIDLANFAKLTAMSFGGCFMGCTAIEEVHFPKLATSFPPQFLRYCTGLKKVFVESTIFIPLASTTALDGCTSLSNIYVADELVAVYKAEKQPNGTTTNNWYHYRNYIMSTLVSTSSENGYEYKEEPVLVRYYNLRGIEVRKDQLSPNEICIVKKFYNNGNFKVTKKINSENTHLL